MTEIKISTKILLLIVIPVLFTVYIFVTISDLYVERVYRAYSQSQLDTKIDIVKNYAEEEFKKEPLEKRSLEILAKYSIQNGFAVMIVDEQGNRLWDQSEHEGDIDTLSISESKYNMRKKYPNLKSDYIRKTFKLENEKSGKKGTLFINTYDILYTKEEIELLNRFKSTLLYIGFGVASASIFIGIFISKNISKTISLAVENVEKISKGNYETYFKKTNTKELNVLGNSINTLGDILISEREFRRKYASDISHEIRTPLALLQSHLEAMMDGLWDPTKERLQLLSNEVIRMGKLIHELEYIEEMENHPIELSEINIKNLIEGVLSNFGNLLKDKNMSCSLKMNDIIIVGNEDKLKQVFINLTSNAIKYAGENSTINIYAKKYKHEVCIHFEDNGKGIEKEHVQHVFERFYKADEGRNREDGQGVGLAIVKAIVEAHKGNIELNIDNGCKYKITLKYVI